MASVVCLNGNAQVQDTFAPLATALHGERELVLKDHEAYARALGEALTLTDEVASVVRAADAHGLSSFYLLGYAVPDDEPFRCCWSCGTYLMASSPPHEWL